MDTTVNKRKYRKRNWKYIETTERDIRLFRTILEQKFLTRDQVIDYIFRGCRNYAEIRIRKLKKFGFLVAQRPFFLKPECYLLGKPGVEALKTAGYAIATKGVFRGKETLPAPQTAIELNFHDHDEKVNNVRFLFEKLGFCKDWTSEKVLRLGTQGERKIPDGIFSRNGKAIAVEIELHPKKNKTYRKIFNAYDSNCDIQYVLYTCGDLSIMKKVMPLTGGSKKCLFALYDDLVRQKEETLLRTVQGNFRLKAVL